MRIAVIAPPRLPVPPGGYGGTGILHSDDDHLARAVLAAVTLDRSACRAAAQTRFCMERMANAHHSVYAGLTATTRAHDAELASVLADHGATDPAEAGQCQPNRRRTLSHV